MTRLVLVVAPLVALAGCSRSSPAPERKTPCLLVEGGFGPSGHVPIRAETVVTGLSVPWGLSFLPGGDWLVTERAGRVRLVTGGQLVPEPVLTVDVAAEGEGGLLGIAASPHFDADHLVYLFATFADPERHHRVLRYRLSADHRSAVLDKVIVHHIPGAGVQVGGRLRFGPDGMLYVSTGGVDGPDDAGAHGGLRGKILRLTPEGGVPADNPHGPDNPVFLSGLRDCQGFDWIHPRFLAVTDQGLLGSGYDEVSVAVSGLHLGWPDKRGCQTEPGKAPPALAWEAGVSPAGAAFYMSGNIPRWTGSLMITAAGGKHLHRVVFHPHDPRKVVQHEAYLLGDPPSGRGRLREVTMGPGADLYVTTTNCDGRGDCPPDGDHILRITGR